MVSDASPGTAAPKMNKSFIHMVYVSSGRACAQEGYLKGPHPTIIDGYEVGQWLGFGWFGGQGTSDMQLARWKLSKKNTPQSWRPPLPYSRHGALPPALLHTTISQHAAQQVQVIKTRAYCCFYYVFISYLKARRIIDAPCLSV